MPIRFRLIVMNFLEFFVWGSWLISLGGYMIVQLQFTGGQVGAVYATMGIASLFMPALMGIVADRWLNAERVFGTLHIIGALLLLWASTITSVNQYPLFYLIMLFNSMAFMPTIALNNTVSYIVLDFPPIRVWGTIGFIAAMWLVDFLGFTKSPMQLYVSAGSGLLLGIYAFTMPACKPVPNTEKKNWMQALGLDAFVLFKQQKMLVFFIFALLLGAALQITNAFGGAFLDDFKTTYPDSFGVQHPNLLLSISQISETLFIL
ncbi:MAG: MFS transporter, partial [Bacteroidetes bacterium]|nr:MFS transporter [Bacteroidota bacterium]